MWKTCGQLASLTRPAASLLVFLSVYLPLLARTGEPTRSLQASIPVLLITICIYLLDHIEDLEGDLINHPDRPLPSGKVEVPVVIITYFLFLFAALVTIKLLANSDAYLYYVLLILGINYNQVAEHAPNIKAAYVAVVSTIPLLILQESLPGEPSLKMPIAAMALYTVGKELCMDFRDRKGDPRSFVHKMTPQSLGATAFSMQATSLFLLAFQVSTMTDIFALIALGLLFFPSMRFWFISEDYRKSLATMRLQLSGGAYFLF